MTDIHDLAEMDGRDLVLTLHPIHEADREHINRASDELGELVRYLVHATLPERVQQTLPYPVSVDDLVKNLRYGIESMPQLLDQLADRLGQLRNEPTLASDSPHTGVTATEHAQQAEDELRGLAGEFRRAAERFGQVRRHTARLKLDASA